MLDIDPWSVDKDDPEAPWNRRPVEDMPETIRPGKIDILLWTIGVEVEPVAYEVTFTWHGGQAVDWCWDISDSNVGLSIMSSAPWYGTATWSDGCDAVEITYSADHFGLEGAVSLPNAAPNSQGLDQPQTWVDLAEKISNYCYGLIQG